MSNLHNCPTCGATVLVVGDEPEGTMYYVNPDGSEHVCDHIPDAGKMVDEMPEEVRDTIRHFRTPTPDGRRPSHERHLLWLADDRERLLARVEDLERRYKMLRQDYSDMRRVDASR